MVGVIFFFFCFNYNELKYYIFVCLLIFVLKNVLWNDDNLKLYKIRNCLFDYVKYKIKLIKKLILLLIFWIDINKERNLWMKIKIIRDY